MDNKSIAGILYETADLLEIDGQDSFRIRSYRNAAEAIEAFPQQISELIGDEKKVLAIPGIGKGMLINLKQMFKEGRLSLHSEMLTKYQAFDAGVVEGPGTGTENHRTDLERLSDLRYRGRGKTCSRRKNPHTPPHGRKA